VIGAGTGRPPPRPGRGRYPPSGPAHLARGGPRPV